MLRDSHWTKCLDLPQGPSYWVCLYLVLCTERDECGSPFSQGTRSSYLADRAGISSLISRGTTDL